jgi:NADP-reducing hydrogenase subunit HndB
MKSLKELSELKEKFEKDLRTRNTDNKPEMIIGMGTCGIAAGARKIMSAIIEEINERDIEVSVSQTGCIGMCEKEPLVDVQMPGEDRITYGGVSIEDAKRIVVEHLINGRIIEDLVIAKLEK